MLLTETPFLVNTRHAQPTFSTGQEIGLKACMLTWLSLGLSSSTLVSPVSTKQGLPAYLLSGLHLSCRNLPRQSGVGVRVSPVGFSILHLPFPYPPSTVPLSAALWAAPHYSVSLPSPASQPATFHTQPWSCMTKKVEICLLTRSRVPTLQTSNIQKLGTGNTHTTGGKFHP